MLYAIKRDVPAFYMDHGGYWDEKLSKDTVYDAHEVLLQAADYNKYTSSRLHTEPGVRVVQVREIVIENTRYEEVLQCTASVTHSATGRSITSRSKIPGRSGPTPRMR